MERQRTTRFTVLPGGRKEDKPVSRASAVDQFQRDQYTIAMVDPEDRERAADLILLAIKRAERTKVFDSYDLRLQEISLRHMAELIRE